MPPLGAMGADRPCSHDRPRRRTEHLGEAPGAEHRSLDQLERATAREQRDQKRDLDLSRRSALHERRRGQGALGSPPAGDEAARPAACRRAGAGARPPREHVPRPPEGATALAERESSRARALHGSPQRQARHPGVLERKRRAQSPAVARPAGGAERARGENRGEDTTRRRQDRCHEGQRARGRPENGQGDPRRQLLPRLPRARALRSGGLHCSRAAALDADGGWHQHADRRLGILVVRRFAGSYVIDALTSNPDAKDSVTATWAIGTQLLRNVGINIVVYACFAIFAAWVAGPACLAVGLRRVSAPTMRNHPLVVYGLVALVLLIVLLTGPTDADRVYPLLVVFALAFVGTTVLRRQTEREFPAATAP